MGYRHITPAEKKWRQERAYLIRAEREKQGYSAIELDRLAGVPIGTTSHMEAPRSIGDDKASKVCKALGIEQRQFHQAATQVKQQRSRPTETKGRAKTLARSGFAKVPGIRQRREALGMGQKQFAETYGINQTTMSAVERGKSARVETIAKICAALDALEGKGKRGAKAAAPKAARAPRARTFMPAPQPAPSQPTLDPEQVAAFGFMAAELTKHETWSDFATLLAIADDAGLTLTQVVSIFEREAKRTTAQRPKPIANGSFTGTRDDDGDEEYLAHAS